MIESTAFVVLVMLGITSITSRKGPLHLLAIMLVEARAACYQASRFATDGWRGAMQHRGEALRRARII